MKNLWILDNYASEPKYGGYSRQYDFAIELAKRGHKVTVVSSSYSHFTKKYFVDKEFQIKNINERVNFVYLKAKPEYNEKNNGINRLFNMISFINLIRKYRKKIAQKCGEPDVVTGCSVHPLTWIAARHISKKYKTKFCIEVRDFWPQVFLANNEMKKTHPFVLFFASIEKWAYKKAEAIIYSLTHGDKYICDDLGYDKAKTFFIPQPMDCERFDKYAIEKKELIPRDIQEFIKDAFVCVFAGYYMEYEGVYVMLKAMKKIKQKNIPVKMLFVGSGKEKEGMLKYVQDNELNNVLIGPRINKEAIPALLKECEICMVQLAAENKEVFKYGVSKNKINEYLYSGACTIFGFDFHDDPVETSGAGYVIKPRSSEILYDKIIEVYNMPKEKREKFGKNGRKYIENYNNVKILGDKLEKIFFDI